MEYLAPLGRYLAHWPPQKANGPWNYSKGHLRLIAPEHYSSKINLRVRRPPFEAEDALKYVEC